jgi:hypothetical protein
MALTKKSFKKKAKVESVVAGKKIYDVRRYTAKEIMEFEKRDAELAGK